MAFCSSCGSSITDGVAFCPRCGAAASAPGPVMGGPAVAPVTGPAIAPAATGIRENVAGLLCYLLGWLTGIVFLLIDKRPFVRFHAAQSIVVFGGLTVIRILIGIASVGLHFFGLWALWGLVELALWLVGVVLWVVLMVTAYQGKRLEIPIAAGLARSLAGNTTI